MQMRSTASFGAGDAFCSLAEGCEAPMFLPKCELLVGWPEYYGLQHRGQPLVTSLEVSSLWRRTEYESRCAEGLFYVGIECGIRE